MQAHCCLGRMVYKKLSPISDLWALLSKGDCECSKVGLGCQQKLGFTF